MTQSYAERAAQEVVTYRNVTNVSDLPPIFSYWSERYLLNKLEGLGIASMSLFYAEPTIRRCAKVPRPVRVASIGSGNGETEVELAKAVRAAGFDNLQITCLEMNSSMQARARSLAASSGLLPLLRFVEDDFNVWEADGTYDLVIASHSLHHVVDLEHLFEQIRIALSPDGVLLINDMIGRNGHLRWPEALRPLQSIWAMMPERYKYNHQLQSFDRDFENRDCSKVGFEGIRAQDILPLLLQSFYPERFLGFANIIGPFIDRGYGHNFDLDHTDDVDFINQVAQFDELAIDLGIVKPTQMIASFRTHAVPEQFHGHRSARFCVRNPDVLELPPQPAGPSPDLERPTNDFGHLVETCDRLRIERDHAQARVDALLSSKSWRLTSPLRSAVSQLRARR